MPVERTKGDFTMTSSVGEMISGLAVNVAVESGLMEAAITLQARWVQTLKPENPSGETYPADLTFITWKGRVIPITADDDEEGGDLGRESDHQASAPEEPPASDRGTLANSINIDVHRFGKVRVGSGLEYARYLEFGVDDHPGGITIEPRPHARPAKEAAEEEMTEALREKLADEVGR